MIRYWNILRKRKHPLKFLISRILLKSGLCKYFVIQKNGFVLRFYPTALSAALWIDPSNRQADEIFFQRYLRPGDIVVDVGANIGSTALAASIIVGQKGQVFAIEAHPRIFRYLVENVKLNQVTNIFSYNVALGDKSGEIYFSDKKADDENAVLDHAGGIKVPVHRLDDLDINTAEITLLKIDVEGFEKYVLEGASKRLEKTKCVYFESWHQHLARYGDTEKDVFDLLMQQGFQIFKISTLDSLRAIPNDYISEQSENLVAVRDIDSFLQVTNFGID